LEHALSYRVPTVLAIPYDVARREVGDVPALEGPRPLPVPTPQDPFTTGAIEGLAADLAAAERPLLLAGRGAWLSGAGEALGRLADATGALTATTALAQGLFPRTEFDLGVAGGFGTAGSKATIGEADVVVVIGASLNQFTMRFGALLSPGTRIVQIDVADSATHPHVGGYIRGDARYIVEQLLEHLERLNARPAAWRDQVDVPALRAQERGEEVAADGLLDPRSAAIRIAELLPEDRVVVSDGGHFIGWANMYWPVASPDRMMMVGTAYQSIGLGFPSVPGAAAARPDSTVVLTSGDGGGLMALADLETAVRVAGGRCVCVVWNDHVYGAETHVYGELGVARGPMEIPETDFAQLAEAFGAEGVVVRRLEDLERLRTWSAEPPEERSLLMLDLRISENIVAPYQEEILAKNR
ncbi:MAG: thiamine pyrophosphate-dependent enzyme, partial [Brachybacterium sp.]|nr:thiamine pyrophosphate-dependent enzyme [Brachybacterium sp.]